MIKEHRGEQTLPGEMIVGGQRLTWTHRMDVGRTSMIVRPTAFLVRGTSGRGLVAKGYKLA